MEILKHDWLTDGMIDYEYKKYILLAYLKDIRKRFDMTQLYPFLSDLVFHYKNLQKIKEKKELMFEKFPKSISKADFTKLRFSYHQMIEDSELMKEIEDIILFALPKLKNIIEEGRELYEFVEENLEFSPVGVTPIYADEGYLFINHDLDEDVNIYRYQVTVFEAAEESYKGISTAYLGLEQRGISHSFENIKISLVKRYNDLPNPATYLVISRLKFPLPETLLPIAKRLLVRHISTTG